MSSFRSSNKVKAEAGMSSMTDLIFLLLIFFIILSLQSRDRKSLTVDLPSSKRTSKNEKNSQVLEVAVSPDNKYFISDRKGQFFELEEIIPLLDEKMATMEDKKIKISGDKEANYEAVFKLIALSKQRQWKPVLIYKGGK